MGLRGVGLEALFLSDGGRTGTHRVARQVAGFAGMAKRINIVKIR
ncbi:hypothetical protein ABI_20490 [Asticcacaulis biprosthecium C19]|uniref:Uncharacterized protein n=1 Tax=Asticcacaulis biprosthecium C19 TaxID=715226 RepID=F4QM36_9CAUL|nr:hypothetical protein ABI_20490 [Asticcacaulis biprosthecium C19]